MNSFIKYHISFKKREILTVFEITILLLFILLPVSISHLFQQQPQSRYIHIESFRYGKNPPVIRCNRGDTLHLTFSSKDTGHSFFLQEFDLDVKVEPSSDRVLVFLASDPGRPPSIKNEVTILAEHPGFLKYFISKSNYHCHVWCGPMHAFEHGSLIIFPNTLLNGGIGFLLGIYIIGIKRKKRLQNNYHPKSDNNKPNIDLDIFSLLPSLKMLIKKRWFQPVLMFLSAIVLYIVLLTSFFGTQMSGRNLGVLLIWIFWLFILIVILIPIGGRIWCTVCPIPMFGEFLQRRSIYHVKSGTTGGYRNRYFGLNYSWPIHLEGEWIRLLLFLIAGTLSTTFVASPRATGFAIMILILLSTLMALIWKLRSFCQYICPINAFIGLYSKLGKLSLRPLNSGVCTRCKAQFCKKGSESGWACPYDLSVNDITDNYKCGLCTECIRSCRYDNVTLRMQIFSSDTSVNSVGMAWTAMAMFVLCAAYCMIYLGPWPRLRDYVNILDKGNWDLFLIYTVVLLAMALLIFPFIVFLISLISKYRSNISKRSIDILISSSGALLPLSLFIWFAFIIQMLFTNVSFIVQSFSDPFGWGWNLFGYAGSPWKLFIPRLVPWIQVSLMIIGFSFTFNSLWRIWLKLTPNIRSAFRGFQPFAIFFLLITSSFIWFFAN